VRRSFCATFKFGKKVEKSEKFEKSRKKFEKMDIGVETGNYMEG